MHVSELVAASQPEESLLCLPCLPLASRARLGRHAYIPHIYCSVIVTSALWPVSAG